MSEENYALQLEKEFDKYRVFKDNRDFTEIKVRHRHKIESKIMCLLRKIPIQLRPDLVADVDNFQTFCEYCVLDYIRAFKKYRIQNNMPESNF